MICCTMRTINNFFLILCQSIEMGTSYGKIYRNDIDDSIDEIELSD